MDTARKFFIRNLYIIFILQIGGVEYVEAARNRNNPHTSGRKEKRSSNTTERWKKHSNKTGARWEKCSQETRARYPIKQPKGQETKRNTEGRTEYKVLKPQHPFDFCLDNQAISPHPRPLKIQGTGGYLLALLLLSSVVPVGAQLPEECGLSLNIKPRADPIGKRFEDALNETFKILQQPYPQGSEVKDHIPQLTTAEVESLYKEVGVVGMGMSNRVFKGQIREERTGAPAGTEVAIRCHRIDPKDPNPWVNRELQAYAYLSKIGPDISHYIPKLHGIWQGLAPPEFTGFYPETTLFCMETEFADGPPYEKAYGGPDNPISHNIPDNVLLSEYIGRWAVQRVAGISINDADGDVLRHHLLKTSTKYTVYKIGDDSYLFPPGYYPVQIDYDHFGFLPPNRRIGPFLLHCHDGRDYYSQRASDIGKEFIKRVCAGEGLFRSIKNTFGKYRVSPENPLPPQNQINYYHIPSEYLED